ncbi:MAG: XRE family transcriptional regulator [Desulfobacca sp.]|nr:XRE family transcriptional regulator [Desulfobacca sp.]
MLAVVKKPRTNLPMFEVKGNIPSKVIEYLHQIYGQNLELVDVAEERVKIVETDWYREIKASTTPGDTVRIYRENLGLTQAELGRKLGKYSRQKISDIEHSKRSISKEAAKKLSAIFSVPVERFL